MFITKRIPKSLSAEAYRSLRTSIKFSSADKVIKTIVVTSSVLGEGKSTVVGNLAYVLSQDGSRVLVIDCDLRRPSLHYKFFVTNSDGLTDILVHECDVKKAIKNVDNSLFLITAGTIPPNPSEILGSKAMEELLDELSINFDYIILDTPPVLAVTDSLLLTAKADATILVVRARRATEKMIKKSYEQLISVRSNLIGTVLNDSDKSIDNKYYGYCYQEKKKGIRRERKSS